MSKKSPLSFKIILFLIGIVFVAFNLRSSITAVGPLIGDIRIATNLTNSSIGIITTLPLLAFAIFSTIAPRIGLKIGNERTVFIALFILTIGILVRSTGMVATLFIGTALLGLGIAICNVLIPAIVKDKFPSKFGLMTGLYTTSMGTLAALASGLSIPLAYGLNLGWEKSLSVWAVLSGLALLFWLPQLRTQRKAKSVPYSKRSIWSSKLAWQVTFFMGFQSCIFYCIIAWVPDILISQGVEVTTAGWMLTLTQLAGLPATLLVPIYAGRFRDQRGLVVGIALLYVLGFIGLYIGGGIGFLSLSIVLIGIAQGAGISLALTLFGLRSESAYDAASLSGMAQSAGYLLAALGPIGMGLLLDLFLTPSPAILLFIMLSVAMMSFGLFAGRNQFVFQHASEQMRA
ncbi:MFS transporter [Alkalihalophilus pseudofirmus]|uniref:MFS transporter n=1 Tax=Alkalihalophilus pseudofirmus TaxID=79885 RepID=A0AAJ2NLD1_ALKPS|nr:MFS transporter [Alkalihalophilus pseudofirmus]MDV2883713.1 MFS transporter [Alkalihalophilus pseudofirmus]